MQKRPFRAISLAVLLLALGLTSTAPSAATFEQELSQAQAGSMNAMHHVGVRYANGNGIKQDYVEAAKWFSRAAFKGHYGAMYSLGIVNELGQGVDVDLVKAHAWYSLAAKFASGYDEWFIPIPRQQMFDRQPREVAEHLTNEQLAKSAVMRDELYAQIRKEQDCNSAGDAGVSAVKAVFSLEPFDKASEVVFAVLRSWCALPDYSTGAWRSFLSGANGMTVKMIPRTGPMFVLLVTLPPDKAHSGAATVPVRDSVLGAMAETASTCEEPPTLHELTERKKQIYYFQCADKSLPASHDKPDEYRYMLQGALDDEGMRLTFTLLSNTKGGAEFDETLNMLRTAARQPRSKR